MPYTKTFTQSPLESLVALLGPRKSVPLQRVTEKREDVPNRPGVYLIWCAKNGRFYVGSSEGSIRYRLRHHLQYLSNGKHTNKFLQADFTEFGSEYFYAAVLELCSKEVAQKQEQKFINETRACLLGYNVAPVTGGVADRQHDRPVRALGFRQSLRPPLPPVDRVVLVLQQIRRRRLRETIEMGGVGGGGHYKSRHARA